MYWNATISERLLSKQKMQDLKWIKLISPGFAIFCLLHHPHHPFWHKKHDKTTWSSTKFKSMCKRTPIPLQSSNPCATWHLYHYKIQIHVQNDPSTKFKSRYTHTELSLYKIQIHVKTKPYKTKGQTKKTLHKIQAPSSYKNSFLKTTYFWHFWLTWIWIL